MIRCLNSRWKMIRNQRQLALTTEFCWLTVECIKFQPFPTIQKTRLGIHHQTKDWQGKIIETTNVYKRSFLVSVIPKRHHCCRYALGLTHVQWIRFQTCLWYSYPPRCPVLSYGILRGNSSSKAAASFFDPCPMSTSVWRSMVFLLGEGHNLQHFRLITSIPEVDKLWRWINEAISEQDCCILLRKIQIRSGLISPDHHFTPFHLLYHNP